MLKGIIVLCCLTAIATAKDAGMKGYGGGDGGQDGYGEAMQGGYGGGDQKPRCGPGETEVTKVDYRPWGNGCGAGGMQVSSEFDFTECCTYTHDVCYATCGMSKATCETLFGDCMKKKCKDEHDDKAECGQNAGMYTMGTTMMGAGAFASSRVEACDCVPDAEAPARQRAEIHKFYKIYAPDQKAAKADALYEKYVDNFPRLFMMLHQKYRDAVGVTPKSGGKAVFAKEL